MMQVMNSPFAGQRGECFGCASIECLNGCRHNRSQQAQSQALDWSRWQQAQAVQPSIDLEKLADLIVERLKRPPGYQG